MLNKELMQRGDAMKQGDSLASLQAAAMDDLKKKIEGYRKEKKQARQETDMLYERNASGELSGGAYRERADELAGQISVLSAKELEATAELSSLKDEYHRVENDMKQVIRYSHLEELTQEAVDTFIKRIYVYKDKRVEIEWNFRSDYEVYAAKTT